MGVIAGLALSLVIPIEQEGHTERLARPLLALRGGLSAPAVYRILERMVETLEALVLGRGGDGTGTDDRRVSARADAEIEKARVRLAGDVAKLQATMPEDADVRTIRDELNRFMDLLLSGSAIGRESNGKRSKAAPAPLADRATVGGGGQGGGHDKLAE